MPSIHHRVESGQIIYNKSTITKLKCLRTRWLHKKNTLIISNKISVQPFLKNRLFFDQQLKYGPLIIFRN